MAKKTISKKKKISWVKRVWNKISNWFKSFWNWLKGINLVALMNLALLSAIIVLFSMLILDITKQDNTRVVVLPQSTKYTVASEFKAPTTDTRRVKPRAVLPLRQNETKSKTIGFVHIVKTRPAPIIIQNIPCQNNVLMSDTVINSRYTATVLKNGTQVNGNLYIQDMRKYTLPCNVVVNGDLILRNTGILNFCGGFTVHGNIYVSPRSSFGPLPRDARIGGHVIL